MVHGIASTDLVTRMARANLLSFVGTGGWSLDEIESSIQTLQSTLDADAPYGFNFLHDPDHPQREWETAELYLRYQVRQIEASAFMQVTPSLALYRLRGLDRRSDGTVVAKNRIMAKVSRPEVARQFLRPAPRRIVDRLLDAGHITEREADWAQHVPMADDITVEADSGGHTDSGILTTLLPTIQRIRDNAMQEHGYAKRVRVGAAGGLGTPDALASVFALGADYVLTGSINQSTVEAGTSDAVKDLLEDAEPQDTALAPAGDMFEFGAKVQVLNKGVFFPSRANKLYNLYTSYDSLSEIPQKTRTKIQDSYFHRSFETVYDETRQYYAEKDPEQLTRMENDPKHRMAKIFRWYFAYSQRIALEGREEDRVNFQVSCGPAQGAFNVWAEGTDLAAWRNRHVDEVAHLLMDETCAILHDRIGRLFV